ncbi:hypothetical protein U9M48_010868 [Paspalum notatum var. saurae]|uniref:Uncharacterized protein n=1 Tax=Paspalum notatum var. saurae TaxID=547442 RepID=A0AAQ3SVY1_PASNO
MLYPLILDRTVLRRPKGTWCLYRGKAPNLSPPPPPSVSSFCAPHRSPPIRLGTSRREAHGAEAASSPPPPLVPDLQIRADDAIALPKITMAAPNGIQVEKRGADCQSSEEAFIYLQKPPSAEGRLFT